MYVKSGEVARSLQDRLGTRGRPRSAPG